MFCLSLWWDAEAFPQDRRAQVSHVGQRWEARARLPFCIHGLAKARRTRTRRVSLVCTSCGVAVVFMGFVGTVFCRVGSY